jgi:hypothetical protein
LCLLLLAPASLTLLSGDPTVPHLLGLVTAITAAVIGIRAFRRTSASATAFLWALIALSLVTWSYTPHIGSPGSQASFAVWILYLGVVKPGGVLALAVVALFAIKRARDRDAAIVKVDASRCEDCGMLPPDHKPWCAAARRQT